MLSVQLVSPHEYAHIYSEKIVHLPHCYFVNDYKQVELAYRETDLVFFVQDVSNTYCAGYYSSGLQHVIINKVVITLSHEMLLAVESCAAQSRRTGSFHQHETFGL